jgi:hypothetical protein
MLDYINIGCTPYEEDCVQVSSGDYLPRMRKETRVFLGQLERTFPYVRFSIKSFPHDFGSYLEVVAWFDDEDEEETRSAYNVEASMPARWDEIAIKELQELGLKEKRL